MVRVCKAGALLQVRISRLRNGSASSSGPNSLIFSITRTSHFPLAIRLMRTSARSPQPSEARQPRPSAQRLGLSAGAHASFKGCCACSSNSATDQGERYERASICRDHHRNTLHFTTACGCTKARRRGPRTRKKERHVTFLRVCGAIFTCGSLVYLARSGACKPCFALTKPARDFADRDKASVPAVRRRRYTTDRNSVRYPHDTRPEHGHRW